MECARLAVLVAEGTAPAGDNRCIAAGDSRVKNSSSGIADGLAGRGRQCCGRGGIVTAV